MLLIKHTYNYSIKHRYYGHMNLHNSYNLAIIYGKQCVNDFFITDIEPLIFALTFSTRPEIDKIFLKKHLTHIHLIWCTFLHMTGKDFVKKLLRDGWELDRVRGSHYIMRKNDVILSVPVHANKDLKTGIFNDLNKKAGYK